MESNPDEKETHLMNVDLDILARARLEPLVAALGEKVSVLYVGREGRQYGAHLELADSYKKDADKLIRDLTALVRKLPRSALRIWKESHSKVFNIGIQGGLKPHSHELALAVSTLQSVVALGARIVVTTYAVEPRRAAPTTKPMDRGDDVRAGRVEGANRHGPRSSAHVGGRYHSRLGRLPPASG
jgi:hypothetical protein